MNDTLNYYHNNSDSFIKSTVNVDFKKVQDHFLGLLPKNPYILDFGCGSGRDTKYFLEQGCIVAATDGSAAICREASIYTGIEIKQELFQELDEYELYDGIWACASILHLKKTELLDVIVKMVCALKSNGIIYTSFKYGEFEGLRNGRYFTDFTAETFKGYIADISNISIEECWISQDARPERGEEKWLNLIIRKS